MAGVEAGQAQNLPTGTITFLLTDIEGSTRRWAEHSSLMGDVVARHDGILICSIEKHHGHDLKKKGEGDSRFAVFTSALNALSAALDIQRNLAKEDWGAVGPLRVRIALHSGEAELREGDYYGPVVNRCARMRGAAHGGQIILSDATRELIAERLPKDVGLRDLGLHRFKDLEEADRIFQVVVADLEDNKRALNSLSAAKHNLPVQLSSFVGRVEQLVGIRKLIANNRLVTLVGVGGGGKTRLSLQVAAELTDEFPDGVWFIDLAPVQDPQLIAQVIAQSLPIAQSDKAPLDAIIENYADGKALLVIDNCEHLISKVPFVVHEILRRCPQVKVLATSREKLSIQGECTYEVPPMNFDLDGKPPTKDIVAQLEAVELLRDRAAKRLSGEDILTDKSAEDVYEICRQVDGIPLAIEQVAASLAFMSLCDARREIAEHMSKFGTPDVGVPDRQQTMEATIDWSFSRLSDDEQKLFVMLSIFDGGCTLKAAEFVCGENLKGSVTFSRLLEQLAKRSLVTFSRSSSRYRMLEPIRQFAAEHLPSSDTEGLRDRHFEWFLNLALQSKEVGLDADDRRYYKLLNADYNNFRRALAWGPTRSALTEKTVELCNALYPYWIRRGFIREGLACLQQAMDASAHMPEPVRGEALLRMGILQWQGDNVEAAERALRASYEVFDRLQDEANRARAYGNLGTMMSMHGRHSDARDVYLEVIPTFEKFGNLHALAPSLENLGVCESELGMLDDAIEHLERAVALHRQLKSTNALAKALDALLGVYAMRGEAAAHADLLLEACNITLAEKEDDFFVFENLLDCGVQICIALKEFELAAQAFGAMEFAVEKSQRVVIPTLLEKRKKMKEMLIEKLGIKANTKAERDGRALGPRSMLGLLCRRLEGEG